MYQIHWEKNCFQANKPKDVMYGWCHRWAVAFTFDWHHFHFQTLPFSLSQYVMKGWCHRWSSYHLLSSLCSLSLSIILTFTRCNTWLVAVPCLIFHHLFIPISVHIFLRARCQCHALNNVTPNIQGGSEKSRKRKRHRAWEREKERNGWNTFQPQNKKGKVILFKFTGDEAKTYQVTGVL